MDEIIERAGSKVQSSELTEIRRELFDLSYKLVNLYERWSVKHQHVARREADMARTIEAFNQQVNTLGETEQAIKLSLDATGKKVAAIINQISNATIETIRESTDMAAKTVGKAAWQTLAGSSKVEVDRLQEGLLTAISNAEIDMRNVGAKYEGVYNRWKLSTWAAAVVAAIVVGCASSWYIWYKMEQKFNQSINYMIHMKNKK